MKTPITKVCYFLQTLCKDQTQDTGRVPHPHNLPIFFTLHKYYTLNWRFIPLKSLKLIQYWLFHCVYCREHLTLKLTKCTALEHHLGNETWLKIKVSFSPGLCTGTAALCLF